MKRRAFPGKRHYKMVAGKTRSHIKKTQEIPEDVLYVHLFSHTHWDFEWYEVQEGFKLQLVRLIEHLLDTLEKDPKFKFHFDGQVMPIMEYLEVLREIDALDNKKREQDATQRIKKYVTKGQLHIGPCWSTPETSLISCESLIRNINRGIRFSKKFGSSSTVFYSADAFQYHSQVPQIITDTGLKAAFTWRAHKQGKPLKDLSLWKGADGTTVFKYYPARTYSQTWHLPNDSQEALEIIRRESELLRKFAVTNHVLITQGNDQLEAQSDINEILGIVDQMIGEKYKIDQVSLEDFFKIVDKQRLKLDTLQGELTGNKWACTLSGQLSARMYLKQKNKKAEIVLEKWAEPFSTFAWLMGDGYPAGLMERAWEYLMKQHFHHCNACAIDAVHREGEVRYKNALELASDITAEALMNVGAKVDVAHFIHENDNALIIFNPSDVERTEVVHAEIITETLTQKITDRQLDQTKNKLSSKDSGTFVLKNEKGEIIPFQILNKKEDTQEIAFWADEIPPLGYKTFRLEFSDVQTFSVEGDIAHEKDNVLENEFVKINIHENGSMTILDKRNGAVLKDQNIIEDSADRGDTYNYDPLEAEPSITTKGAQGKITLITNGHCLGTFEVRTKLAIPEGLTPDRKARSDKIRNLPIRFHITLKKGSPLVYVAAEIDNQIKDHRLRVLFPGPKSDYVYVQTQGDVVKRRITECKAYPQSKRRDIAHHTSIGPLPKEKGPSRTQFQRNFVGVNNGKKGLIIFNKGLPEFETKTDGTIALTLLRCVGWLSRDDLNTREGRAGPKIAVPDAQCMGKHTFEYAVLSQPVPWKITPIYWEENRFSIPLRFFQIRRQEGHLPTKLSFLSIKPNELMISAIKKAYTDNDLIIRLFNPTGKRIKGSMSVFPVIKAAWLADLNEEKRRELSVQNDGTLFIEVGPKKIITIRIMAEKNNRFVKGSRKTKVTA